MSVLTKTTAPMRRSFIFIPMRNQWYAPRSTMMSSWLVRSDDQVSSASCLLQREGSRTLSRIKNSARLIQATPIHEAFVASGEAGHQHVLGSVCPGPWAIAQLTSAQCELERRSAAHASETPIICALLYYPLRDMSDGLCDTSSSDIPKNLGHLSFTGHGTR